MRTVDFSPLYRSSVGFDRLFDLLENASRGDQKSGGYPPYNIEAIDKDRYQITIAVAGFSQEELEIQSESNKLVVRGQRSNKEEGKNYLYQGIAARDFERTFELADHVRVTGASLRNGLLMIDLLKEIPEAMQPRKIAIS